MTSVLGASDKQGNAVPNDPPGLDTSIVQASEALAAKGIRLGPTAHSSPRFQKDAHIAAGAQSLRGIKLQALDRESEVWRRRQHATKSERRFWGIARWIAKGNLPEAPRTRLLPAKAQPAEASNGRENYIDNPVQSVYFEAGGLRRVMDLANFGYSTISGGDLLNPLSQGFDSAATLIATLPDLLAFVALWGEAEDRERIIAEAEEFAKNFQEAKIQLGLMNKDLNEALERVNRGIETLEARLSAQEDEKGSTRTAISLDRTTLRSATTCSRSC